MHSLLRPKLTGKRINVMNWKSLEPVSLMSVVAMGLTAPAFSSQPVQSEIIAIGGNGDVRIQHGRRQPYFRARVNTDVSPNARLRVGEGASVIVLCKDWSNWVPPVGESQVPQHCGIAPNVRRGGTRDPKQFDNLPYLIYSRNTTVLPDQPLVLTWNPVAGATDYEVTINLLAQPVRTITVTEPRLRADNLEDFQPDRTYYVTISAILGASGERSTVPERGSTASAPFFRVLGDENMQALEADLAKLEGAELTGEAYTLVLACLYESHGLYQLALDTLAEPISGGTQNAAVYQLQGELYEQVELERYAQTSYQTALELAQQDDNTPQQAELQERLGQIAFGTEAFALAIEYWTAAEVSYRAFLDGGDPEAQAILADLAAQITAAQDNLPAPAP